MTGRSSGLQPGKPAHLRHDMNATVLLRKPRACRLNLAPARLAAVVLGLLVGGATVRATDLASEFRQPPEAARPWVFEAMHDFRLTFLQGASYRRLS